MKKRVLGSAVVSACLLWTAPVEAKDIYVRAGESGSGTKASPWGDVDQALRDANSGDVIHVAEGTYFGAANGGTFRIAKPDLTLVGGYSKDFAERHPFKHLTRLMQGEDPDPKMCRESKRCTELVTRQKVPQHKSSYNGEAIVRGEGDHANAVLDGFVVDGYTRHRYKANEDLSLDVGPLTAPGVEFTKKGGKIRNCIVVNIGGPGIRINSYGTKLDDDQLGKSGDDWAEVSNSIVINTLMKSIDLTVGDFDAANAPKGGCGLIKNNTFAFNWERSGHDFNLYQGRQTQLTVQDNVLAFAGFGVGNMFENRFGRYVGNVFFGHTGGEYKYYDPQGTKATLVLDDVAQLEGEKCKKQFQCSKQSKGNALLDPKFKKVDGFFLDKFFNQVASSGGGKVSMDSMNQWRSAVGLPLQGSAGTGKQNYAPLWDPAPDFSALLLFSDAVPGKGAQFNGIDGQFRVYQSATAAPVARNYKEVEWGDLQRGKAAVGPITATGDAGLDVMVKLKVKEQDMSTYALPAASGVARDKGWLAFRDESRDVLLYVKSGSQAHTNLQQVRKEGALALFKGTAFSTGGSKDKVGLRVDAVETLDAD